MCQGREETIVDRRVCNNLTLQAVGTLVPLPAYRGIANRNRSTCPVVSTRVFIVVSTSRLPFAIVHPAETTILRTRLTKDLNVQFKAYSPRTDVHHLLRWYVSNHTCPTLRVNTHPAIAQLGVRRLHILAVRRDGRKRREHILAWNAYVLEACIAVVDRAVA